jgi:hypothetical protein
MSNLKSINENNDCPLCNLENRKTLENELKNNIIEPEDLDKKMNWNIGTTYEHQINHIDKVLFHFGQILFLLLTLQIQMLLIFEFFHFRNTKSKFQIFGLQ